MALKEIAEDIAGLSAESVHLWLRDSYLSAQQKFEPAPFAEVEAQVSKLGWPLIEGWENGTAALRRHLVSQDVFEFGAFSAYSYAFFVSMNEKDGRYPFVPTDVTSVEIGLLVNVDQPFEDVTAKADFPTDSVLARCLKEPEVDQKGRRWPFLSRILVHFGHHLRLSSDQKFFPSAFFLDVEFVASLDQEIGHSKISCTFESLLDSPRDFHNAPAPSPHEPRDQITNSFCHLATEGWHSVSDSQIEQWKDTYLRTATE